MTVRQINPDRILQDRLALIEPYSADRKGVRCCDPGGSGGAIICTTARGVIEQLRWDAARDARRWLDSLPPPKPGTHESDLDVSPVWPYCSPGNNYEAASTEFRRAMRWSRAKAEADRLLDALKENP